MSTDAQKNHEANVNSAAFAIGFRKIKTKDKTVVTQDERKMPLLSTDDDMDHTPQPRCDTRNDLKQVKKLILGSKINLLLIAVPFGIISNYAGWPATVTFFFNFFGMIPLASILGDSTECLSDHLGETIGGLLNATFGNAVELVVMILALSKAKSYENQGDTAKRDTMITVVQFSLIGSVFSNSLLVLGCSFLAHGFKEDAQFSVAATSANVSLLMLASFVMMLPAPYSGANQHDELMVSRVAAVLLLIMYSCLLIFVMYTHKHLMDEIEEEPAKRKSISKLNKDELEVVVQSSKSQNTREVQMVAHKAKTDEEMTGFHAMQDEGMNGGNTTADAEEEDDDDLEMTLFGSMTLLFVSTTFVALLSEYLVGAIEPMSSNAGITEAFIGLILVPIIGNAVEHITAIRMALKGKMDISLSIAIGSATQVAMFVVGLSVIVGWILDIPMTLDFPQFEVVMFIYTSIIVFALVSNGSSNWLKGAMLLCLYVMIAVAVYHQPAPTSSS